MSEGTSGNRLRLVLTALVALAAALALAACGGDDTVGGGSDEPISVAEGGKASGDVTISNWPGYIDPGNNGTVAEFEEESGVAVDYIEDINDNVQFFGKLQPQLDQGQSGGRSIFVVTDWMAKQMYDLGYLQEIDHESVPTVFENITSALEDSALDPGRKFSIPWQAGMTGIWVNTKQAPEIRSINDLFDPKYRGRVTFLTEMRDTVPLVMRGMGVEDTANATKEEWLAAIDKLDQAAQSGQIRRFTGNEYTEDLTAGNVVAAVGWSGDASLIGTPDAEWRRPVEGCNLWADNMVIPVGAPNTAAALEWMNFVYRPEVQADIAAYVNYVTPVAGVAEILRQKDPELAKNQLIFPSDEFTRDCQAQSEPPGSAQDQQEITEAFQDVVTG